MSFVDVPDCNICSKFGLLEVFFGLLKQVLTPIHTHSIDATLLEYLALTLDDHSFTSAAAKYCRPQLGIKQQLRKESPYKFLLLPRNFLHAPRSSTKAHVCGSPPPLICGAAITCMRDNVIGPVGLIGRSGRKNGFDRERRYRGGYGCRIPEGSNLST